jgi:hypothetical protein
MKTFSITVVFTIVLLSCLLPLIAEEHSQVSVVIEGKSDWRIERASKENSATQWAAQELQTYIRRISRCTRLRFTA